MFRHISLLLFLALELLASTAWAPIPEEDLLATSCPTDQAAKAENLFVHETIDDNDRQYTKRLKIYSVDEATLGSLLSVSYQSGEKVWDLSARITSRDGASREFDKSHFSRTETVRTRWGKEYRLSLALGRLEDGDVIDIQWKRNLKAEGWNFSFGLLQDKYPTREYRVLLRQGEDGYSYKIFHANAEILNTPSGKQMVCRNLPPLLDEPHSPPPLDSNAWHGLFPSEYLLGRQRFNIWQFINDHYQEKFHRESKPRRETKDIVAQCSANEGDPEARLSRLYDWCRTSLVNLDFFKSTETEVLRRKRERSQDWSVQDTLTQRGGRSEDINAVFGALATAAGFETRLVWMANRSLTIQTDHEDGHYFMNDSAIAVRLGEDWRLYVPGDYYTPAGLLNPSNESVPYMRCEKKARNAVSPQGPLQSYPPYPESDVSRWMRRELLRGR